MTLISYYHYSLFLKRGKNHCLIDNGLKSCIFVEVDDFEDNSKFNLDSIFTAAVKIILS
jgi:hypothetical protein